MQTPFVQLVLQGRLQPPQLVRLVSVSTHAPLHDIWPATEQPQLPLLQVAPPEQALPQVPQLSGLVMTFVQAPPEHCISPAAQLLEQAPPLHTCVPEQVVVQVPQWLLSEATQAPPQSSKPAPHLHTPAWQDLPVPHLLPQVPQFWLSVCAATHDPLQATWPVPQDGPLDGVAQPAATRPRATQARADKRRLRTFMTETPYVRAGRG
jgi:hypothetical protein